MSINREPRGAVLEALHRRAAGEAGEAFADALCAMLETYQATAASVSAGHWPEWPTPGDTTAQAERIMRAVGEVLAATGEASEAVQARLRFHLREAGRDPFDFEPGGATFRALSDLLEAAAAIRQAQPVDKHGRPATKRKDALRDGFLRALRELFTAHGVAWSSTADEWSEYQRTSLAVAAVAAALNVTPPTASKAIQRIDTT